jgi:SAM-dependent methyltransferase
MSQQEWDERYATTDQIWSGRPNGALVSEVADLALGRALDVGCGEGADAIWLVQQGWQVTALDVSQVALARAAAAAHRADVTVQWLHAGLLEAELPAAGFDLVSAQYAALLRTPGHEAEHALLAAVAPGGTLLVVHHADFAAGHGHEDEHAGFDPADYVSPSDVVAALGDGWTATLDERRPRLLTSGAGAGHSHDVVLRATRVRS